MTNKVLYSGKRRQEDDIGFYLIDSQACLEMSCNARPKKPSLHIQFDHPPLTFDRNDPVLKGFE